MSQLNSSKIPIAVESHTRLDLPFDHASTGAFMLLQPMYYRHMVKTEKIDLRLSSVVRPNPIVCPTFGRCRQNLRAFFVPYYQIFPQWEEFINDTVASNFSHSSQVNGVPYFTSEDVMNAFVQSTYSTPAGTGPYDFKDGSTPYKFTRFGRNAYKIFYSLGYDILPSSKTFKFNSLALLAWAKVYCDWYANQQYLNDATYLALQRLFKYNDPTTALHVTTADLHYIFTFVRPAVYNTNGYFEGAWDNPVSPVNGQFTSFQFTDPTSSNGSFVTTNADGTPEMYQSNNSSVSLGSSYLHSALQKLSEYQRRHALSGAMAIDRVLTTYGIKTANLRIQRSIYVGVQSIDIDIKSIYATAAGQNSLDESNVGDYAGAGYGQGQQDWQFSSDDDGIFIVISSIQPSGGYYQGYDRNNRALLRNQFYNPAFDRLGVQIIEKGEVYVSKNGTDFASSADDYATKFAYTGRYAERKRSINRVSGDFALPSVLAGGDSWHLMREFDDVYFNGSVVNINHSEDFCRGTDAEQYFRIFTYTKYDNDPFNLFLHVDCTSYAPMHSLTDTFDWEDESNKISVDTNGAKLN